MRYSNGRLIAQFSLQLWSRIRLHQGSNKSQPLLSRLRSGSMERGRASTFSAALSLSPASTEFAPCVLSVSPAFWQSEAGNKSRTDFACSGWQRTSLPLEARSKPLENLREFPYLRNRHKPDARLASRLSLYLASAKFISTICLRACSVLIHTKQQRTP